MATLSDIASHAGISESSVSRILNGHRKANSVTGQMRVRRVQQIAEQLGYKPNLAARATRTNRTGQIGVLVSELANPATGIKIEAIEHCLAEYDYRLLLGLVEANPAGVVESVRRFAAGMVDGLINLVPNLSQERLEELSGGLPVVTHNRAGANSPALIDYEGGMGEVIRHFVSHGHSRIGLVTGPSSDMGAVFRLNAFLSSCLSLGVSSQIDPVWHGSWRLEDGQDAARVAAERGWSAVVVANDLMAIGFIRGMRKLGKSVPRDCSVVAFEDTSMLLACDPEVSALHTPTQPIAQRTVDSLIRQIQGETPLAPEKFRPEFILRESTGPCSRS